MISKFLYLSKLIVLPAALIYAWYTIQTTPEYQYGGVYIVATIISIAMLASIFKSIRNRLLAKNKPITRRLNVRDVVVSLGEEEFSHSLENRLERIKTILTTKGEEYSGGNDKFHNFNLAAQYSNISPKLALWGMFLKHFISIRDYVKEERDYTLEQLDEKFGDAINYLILLEIMSKKEKTYGETLKEELEKREKETQEKLFIDKDTAEKLEKENKL
jgi:hypothetical protein